MTHTMELSYSGQEELIADACEESIRIFPQLEGGKFSIIFRLPVKDLDTSVLRDLKSNYDGECILSKSRIFHPSNPSNPSNFYEDTLIEILHVSNEVTIKSFGLKSDEPTIWIGNRLEKYLKTSVLVRYPDKLVQPKPPNEEPRVKEIIREKQVIVKIRCSYCKNTYDETLDRCPNCGGKN
jgi:hypothetical protein